MQLFVYGTLKRGGRWFPHYLLDSPFIGHMSVHGLKLFDTNQNYPIAVKTDDPKDVIHGEVYEINGDIKRRLDMLEQGYTLVEITPKVYSYVRTKLDPREVKSYDMTPIESGMYKVA